jgi:trafficking protein particle complex subunit 10
LIFSYETEATTQPPNWGGKFFKCPRILLYRHPDAFDVKLFASRAMHLDRNRSLEIELSSGWNDVLDGELHIRAGTAGLRLQTSEVSPIDGDFEVLKQPEAGIIRFGSFHAQSKVKIRLPYSLEHDVNDISIRLEISYNTSDGTFFFATNPSVSTMLPLGVNVQDVFKHKALFSRFTISSATGSPLRLLSSRLDGSDLFEARNGGSLRSPVVIFPRQPASLLYRITRRSTPLTHSDSRKRQKPSLSLTLYYICLDEEIDQAIDSALSTALRDSPFRQYSRLIVPTVLTQLRSNISANDLERTGLLGELPLSTLSELEWHGHFAGLGRDSDDQNISDLIAQWILAWCEQTHIIILKPITANSETITKSRSIIIPVDVPSITVVHTADIRLLKKPTNGDVAAVSNQPIPASLQIKWTRIWDMSARPPKQRSVQAAGATSEASKDMEFVYEVTAAADTWLIGGKWKGHFKIPSLKEPAQSEFLKFPILLVPIKEGYLPYPHLEIKPTPIAKPAAVDGGSAQVSSPEEAEGNDAVTCETDYKNIGEVIRVISNAQKTTVNLDACGPQGGAWLLDSETRGNEGDVFVG